MADRPSRTVDRAMAALLTLGGALIVAVALVPALVDLDQPRAAAREWLATNAATVAIVGGAAGVLLAGYRISAELWLCRLTRRHAAAALGCAGCGRPPAVVAYPVGDPVAWCHPCQAADHARLEQIGAPAAPWRPVSGPELAALAPSAVLLAVALVAMLLAILTR